MKYFLESLLFTTFLSLVLLSTLNAGGILSRQEPTVDTSESKIDIEDSYKDTYLSSLHKEFLREAFLLKEIEEARNSRLIPFIDNGLAGKITADKQNITLDTNGWDSTTLCALSNNRAIGIYHHAKKYQEGCRKDFLFLKQLAWNENSTNELWRKEITAFCPGESFPVGIIPSIVAVSNDGKNIFVTKALGLRIVWWKFQIEWRGLFNNEYYLNRVAKVTLNIPEEHRENIASMGYLDSFNKLCLFDKNQDALCLIDLNEYDSNKSN